MGTLMSLDEEIHFIPAEPTSNGKARGRWRVLRRILVAGVGGLAALLIGIGVQDAVRQSRREQCAQQLKKVGIALHEFHHLHGHFPAPALTRPDGTPLLSWRVAILPQLGYRSLYERFHRDEPWDSPRNRALLAEMPIEFACPGGPARWTGKTGYLVVVGPRSDPTSVNTPFEPTRGVDLREMTDGTSNTILIFETNASIDWTRPEDLRWVPGGALPLVASPHLEGTHVLLGDGSTRFVKRTIDPQTLQSILTINGGEVIGGG